MRGAEFHGNTRRHSTTRIPSIGVRRLSDIRSLGTRRDLTGVQLYLMVMGADAGRSDGESVQNGYNWLCLTHSGHPGMEKWSREVPKSLWGLSGFRVACQSAVCKLQGVQAELPVNNIPCCQRPGFNLGGFLVFFVISVKKYRVCTGITHIKL